MTASPGRGRSLPLIEKYAAGAALPAYAVFGLSPEQEQARPGPGGWSIAELVVHLLDADLVYAERIKRVIAEDEPALLNMDETAWVERLGAQAMPVGEAVSLFAANRQWTARILRRLDDDAFARTGVHSVRGRVTLADLLSTVTNHVDHHLTFLFAKRARLGVAIQPRYGTV